MSHLDITQVLPQTIRWENDELYFIDQTQLPLQLVEEKQETVEQVWNAIKELKVRGAPAIGIAGAYGLVIAMRDKRQLSKDKFITELKKQAGYLDSARPTAVNLSWALRRMLDAAGEVIDESVEAIYRTLYQEAKQIHEEDRKLCRSIGEHGKHLIKEGMGVLTHCNAGSLAVSQLGTALAPIYLAYEDGVHFKVYADETRPLLQGARLTAWELQRAGVDVTLICDNMAASMMSQGLIQLVIVGADRVAANGDAANKIGTMGVAILANYFSIPFYVACPYSTIDLNTLAGEDIKIEERKSDEVTHFGLRKTAPEGISVRNPAFDVTPHKLIAGIITERGIITEPYERNLAQFIR